MKHLHNKIIIRLLQLLYGVDMSRHVNYYITLFTELRKKSGLPYAIKYYKAVKLHITRYICGKPLLVNKAGVAVDKSGFPTRFLYLKEILDKGYVRSVLSLLTYTRAVKPTARESSKIKVDYSTITDLDIGVGYTIPASFIKSFVLKNNLSLKLPLYNDESFYVSTKGSPNGPATVSSL